MSRFYQREELLVQRRKWKQAGQRVVFTNGCYDIIHPGHVSFLEQAKALGFAATPIRTLETGCESWFDYHFIDDRTAMFALDNMIYTIRRQ